jgi:hypothetical protein
MQWPQIHSLAEALRRGGVDYRMSNLMILTHGKDFPTVAVMQNHDRGNESLPGMCVRMD